MKKRQLIIGQIIFWILLFLVETVITTNFLTVKHSMYGVFFDIGFGMIIFYVNLLVLFPKFFNKKDKKKYFTFNLLLLLTLVFIHGYIISLHIQAKAIEFPVMKNIPKSMPYNKSLIWLLLIDVISFYIPITGKIKEKELKNKELKEQKLETEIKFLKAQINPHFVFNALNNIYSLAYSKSDKAPESIIKLSQMLRYVFYEGNKEKVSLKSEIEYIKNFIAFQQMKSPHEQNITFNKSGNECFEIAPVLFIPFVENSFKYSRIEELQDAKVEIDLKCSEENLVFEISNTFPEDSPAIEGSGMGIENVKKRLKLIYPEKHEFKVEQKEGMFKVYLKIDK